MNTNWYISVLLLIGMQAKGCVIGYARLYNPETKKSVDILYDKHQPERSLSDYDFQTLPVDEIKQQLYPTERHFLEAVEYIDVSDDAEATAIVGESNGSDHAWGGKFLGYLNSLVADRLQNITYVDADMIRRNGQIGPLHTMLPLSSGTAMRMIFNAGESAWRNYYEYYCEMNKKSEELTWWNYCWNYDIYNENWYALADVEMLLHILSLSQSRIIVYCGGWHGAHLTQFLKEKAGFVDIYGYETGPVELWTYKREIDCDHLWPLEYSPVDLAPKS